MKKYPILFLLTFYIVNVINSQSLFKISPINSEQEYKDELKILQDKVKPIFDTIALLEDERFNANNFFASVKEGNYYFINSVIDDPALNKIFKRNNYDKNDFLNLTKEIKELKYRWYYYAWENDLEYIGSEKPKIKCPNIKKRFCKKQLKFLNINDGNKILLINFTSKQFIKKLIRKYKNIEIYLSFNSNFDLTKNYHTIFADDCILKDMKSNSNKIYIIDSRGKSDFISSKYFDVIWNLNSKTFSGDINVFNNNIRNSTTIFATQSFFEDNKNKTNQSLISKKDFEKQLKSNGLLVLDIISTKNKIRVRKPIDKSLNEVLKEVKFKQRMYKLKNVNI